MNMQYAQAVADHERAGNPALAACLDAMSSAAHCRLPIASFVAPASSYRSYRLSPVRPA